MITIDTKEFEKLSKDLIELHRAAFPNAIRFTLNDLAFDVKQKTLAESVKKNFQFLRQPNLFKKYSGVMKAAGWEISKMESTVGMMPSGSAFKVVSRLEAQEKGGSLDSAFIPDDVARVGGLHKGKVLRNKWLGKVRKLSTVQYGDKQGLIRAVTGSKIQRGGKGKGNAILYGNILYEIKGFKRFRKTDKIELHLDRIYSYKRNRKVQIKPTHFVEKAAIQTGPRVQEFFNKNAAKQLEKFKNR